MSEADELPRQVALMRRVANASRVGGSALDRDLVALALRLEREAGGQHASTAVLAAMKHHR